jgi:mRNA interferase MazF
MISRNVINEKGRHCPVPFPFTDLSGTKNRPALILINKENDVTLAFISSRITRAELTDIRLTPSANNGLKRDSLIRLDKIATVSKNIILGRLGSVTEKEILEIDKSLLILFQIK